MVIDKSGSLDERTMADKQKRNPSVQSKVRNSIVKSIEAILLTMSDLDYFSVVLYDTFVHT